VSSALDVELGHLALDDAGVGAETTRRQDLLEDLSEHLLM
jgi:hypothetical protein